jgi:hypothetical protein
MPNQIQILRSSTAGARPAGKQPGEPYINFADAQFGVFNAAPVDLIAVRYFSTLSAYAAGDHVIQAGILYVANAATGPGPFLPAFWDTVSAGTGGPFLPLSGGIMSGAITTLPPVAATDAANKNYVDTMVANLHLFLGTWSVAANNPNISGTPPGIQTGDYYMATTVVPATPETAPGGVLGIGGTQVNNGDLVIWNGALFQRVQGSGLTVVEGDARYVMLAGGIMTGPLVLDADPTAALGAATKQYVDDLDALIAQYLPLVGGTLTGTLNISPPTVSARLNLNSTGLNALLQLNSVNGLSDITMGKASSGGYSSTITGVVGATQDTRWRIDLVDATAETGGNTGSNFGIVAFSDDNSTTITPLSIARATGVVNFSTTPTVVGVPIGGIADAPSDGNAYLRSNAAWSTVIDAGTF